jgi:integrase
LLIVGDTFGFWELTLVQGVETLDHIVAAHQAIFDQLRATGERIKITMMVGNHDYDLACNAAFAARLRAYNIYLDKSLVLIRRVGDKKIWIEHGQQHDEFNAFPDYGNPYPLPVGYFITESFVSGASRHSDFGRGNWLKDIRSVGTLRRDQGPHAKFVFTSERSAPFTTDALNRHIKRLGAKTKIGFPIHVHMLWHACGYALANAGHDTRSIQDYLGHKSIQHTVRYTELSPTKFKDFWR